MKQRSGANRFQSRNRRSNKSFTSNFQNFRGVLGCLFQFHIVTVAKKTLEAAS